jgi:hypothetical protein
MTNRTFSLGLIAGALCLFIATVLANIVLDPQSMFGTHFVTTHISWNDRYNRFLAYQRDARQVDGLLFGSSRGGVFDVADMARLTGNEDVASFAVTAGAIPDYLAFLQYIVRDKAAHGERLRSVLLLLDPDNFGTTPWGNRNLDSFLPPEVSGESKLRFWMRYLVAFQFGSWRESLRRTFGISHRPEGLAITDHSGSSGNTEVAGRADAGRLIASDVGQDRAIAPIHQVPVEAAGPQATTKQLADAYSPLARMRNSFKPFLGPQIDDFKKFVLLCRNNGIQLTVAFNPLQEINALSFEPGHLEAMVQRINQLADVWDFSAPAWLARDPSYWLDNSHFKPEIAAMMLERMFGNGAGVPADFGRFRARTSQ